MSAHVSTPGIHLQNLVLDESFTAEQKADCLKVLKLIIKNLADPVKAQEPKYRQIKLSNEKIASKLVPITAAMDYLKAIGFVEAVQDSVEVLKVEETNVVVMKASLQEVSNALDLVAPNHTVKSATTVTKQRSVVEEEEKKSDDYPMVEKLSEKQKARMLLEEKQRKDKEEARKHRAKNIALLKQDNHVRKHDENWKSGVSAAMAKSGNGIETFRDRHGEGN